MAPSHEGLSNVSPGTRGGVASRDGGAWSAERVPASQPAHALDRNPERSAYLAGDRRRRVSHGLIDHAAKLDLRDKLGFTALHWAAERGRVEVMRLLLAARALVDVQNTQGITPLMLAASSGNVGAVRLLLQNRADPLKQDYTGQDAFGWAGNRTAVIDLLKNAAAH
jgi:ankyrin repeat protein